MQSQLHHRILIDFSRAQTAPMKHSAPSNSACKVMVDDGREFCSVSARTCELNRTARTHNPTDVQILRIAAKVKKSDGQVDLSQVDLIGQSGLDRPKWTWSAKVDLIGQSGPGRPKWTWSAEVDLIGQSGPGRPKWTWSAKVDLVGQSGRGRPKWTWSAKWT